MSPTRRLTQHRSARGWSQAALAERCGVSRSEISGIETGRLVPSVTVALRLASLFGQSVESLFGEDAARSVHEWAWSPVDGEHRLWSARIEGRVRWYPVEPTAAGVLAHDAVRTPSGDVESCGEGTPAERTLVLAGCDPMAALLVQEAAAQHRMRVLPLLRSSTQALMLLKQGLVHMAGLHFTVSHGSDNDRAVRAALGPGYTLIHQVNWDAGVALAPSRRERTPRALLRANVRWVNREEGSAARMAFDRLLGQRPRPAGYERVVHDHRAVAATVSSGWAEAGMCVSPAAAEARLTFLPLQRESYEICVANALLHDPRVAAVISILQSIRYRRLVADVPGCVAARTGECRAVA